MSEEELFCRRPMGMRMAMIVRQWRAVIDDAILDTGLTQSSWTVMMQLHQLGDNVSMSELAEVHHDRKQSGHRGLAYSAHGISFLSATAEALEEDAVPS